MRCEECRLIIEEYIDGELNERETGMVSAHLAACASCSASCEEFELEHDIYSHYKRDVEFTPALWAGVKARIDQEKVSRNAGPLSNLRDFFGKLAGAPAFNPAFACASAVLAVAAITWIIWSNQTAPNVAQEPKEQPPAVASKPNPKEEKSPTAVPSVEGPGETAPAEAENNRLAATAPIRAKYEPKSASSSEKRSKQSAQQLVREAEQKYVEAIGILSRDAKARRSQLTPETIAQFNEALAAIDRTIAETRSAVQKDPKDPIAVQYMLAAYSKKVDVLKVMASY